MYKIMKALRKVNFDGIVILDHSPSMVGGRYAQTANSVAYMGYNTAPLVLRAGVRPTWLPDDRFWYRVTTENGNEFVLVDAARGTRGPAFDHARVAAALSAAAGA